jgi:predicted ATP-dependent serine protease
MFDLVLWMPFCSQQLRFPLLGISSTVLLSTFIAYVAQLVIEAIAEIHPRAVIVDSIQTVYLAEANGSAGSVSQVRR